MDYNDFLKKNRGIYFCRKQTGKGGYHICSGQRLSPDGGKSG